MPDDRSERAAYERDVSRLAAVTAAARAQELPDEVVARMIFAGRNALKLYSRRWTSDAANDRLELRNVADYGNVVSRSIDDLYARYGSWAAVADAAGRPGGIDLLK